MNRPTACTAPAEETVIRALGALALTAAFLSGCGGPPVTSAGPLDATATVPDDAARDTAAWLAGHYSSAAQAREDASFFDVRLHIVPIWTDRADGPWLYVEQAMASTEDKPYRQRIYRVIPVPGGKAESTVYELPGDPLQWAGAWNDVARFNALDPGILQVRAGCSVTLGYAGPGTLRGSTDGSSCGTALRGAAYATSEVTVTPELLTTWDRGFDAAGKQVWGSTKGPYRFVKERPAPAGALPPEAPLGDEAAVAVPPSESVTR